MHAAGLVAYSCVGSAAFSTSRLLGRRVARGGSYRSTATVPPPPLAMRAVLRRALPLLRFGGSGGLTAHPNRGLACSASAEGPPAGVPSSSSPLAPSAGATLPIVDRALVRQNSISLVGKLLKAPVLKSTSAGEVATSTLEVTRYTKRLGAITDRYEVEGWNEGAQLLMLASEGMEVHVNGRLRLRNWKDEEDDSWHTVVSVTVQELAEVRENVGTAAQPSAPTTSSTPGGRRPFPTSPTAPEAQVSAYKIPKPATCWPQRHRYGGLSY